MTVVYLDSVFLLNGIMDYLMFLSAATLAGLPLRRGRYILAALLGGTYAAAVFLPGLGGLASLPAKAAAGILLGVTAFGGEEHFGRLMLLTFAACGKKDGNQQAGGTTTSTTTTSATESTTTTTTQPTQEEETSQSLRTDIVVEDDDVFNDVELPW